MTWKDYAKIASALRKVKPHYVGTPLVQWEIDRDAIAQTLQEDNPRFDRDRFYAACEGR